MARAETDFIVGLDTGTAGVTAVVLNTAGSAGQELAGVGYAPAVGFARGAITSPEDAVGSIKRAVADAELAAGVQVSYVYVCADVPGMLVLQGTGKYRVGSWRGISRVELLEANNKTLAGVLPAGYTVVQSTGVEYLVDGKPTPSPLGARGRELQVVAASVAARGEWLEEMHRCFSMAGLKVKQTVPGPRAAAEAVLDGMERELGTVLVDIGAGLTRASYINQGSIRAMQVFPVGSGHITSDLALVLHTTLEEAERVKTTHGLKTVRGSITVRTLNGGGDITVPGELAHRVMLSRVEEMLDFISGFVNSLQLTATLPGGVVITGGGAMLAGLPDLAGRTLDMPVRTGIPRLVPASVPEEEIYRYVNAVGLALWAAGQASGYREPKGGRLSAGFMDRIRHWLE